MLASQQWAMQLLLRTRWRGQGIAMHGDDGGRVSMALAHFGDNVAWTLFDAVRLKSGEDCYCPVKP